jgi:hypothetical protein
LEDGRRAIEAELDPAIEGDGQNGAAGARRMVGVANALIGDHVIFDQQTSLDPRNPVAGASRPCRMPAFAGMTRAPADYSRLQWIAATTRDVSARRLRGDRL